NGAVFVTTAGGTTPYSYNWGSGAGTNEDTLNLTAGTYTVTIQDGNGCSLTLDTTITEPQLLDVVLDSLHNVNCNGELNGGVFVSVTGGTTAYSFNWSNGVTTEDNNNIAAGNYAVTVTDAHGCTDTLSATITEPTILNAVLDSVHAVSCNGSNDGAIYVTISGGTTAYSFNWSNGSTNEDATTLTAGTYNFTVTDAHGCKDTLSATVTQPQALAIRIDSVHQVHCHGGNDGAIYITPSGGTTAYNFNWSNSTSNEDATTLVAGHYTVTLTDAHGCTITRDTTITEPSSLIASLDSVRNEKCFGDANGATFTHITGGVAPYAYLWSNGAVTQNLNAVAAGTYTLTVTDANGCTDTTVATITQPQLLDITLDSVRNVKCFGQSNGGVFTSVIGGTGPYTYVWTNGAGTVQDPINLPINTYAVTVTDAHGCTDTLSAVITQPAVLTVAVDSFKNVSCNSGNDGAVYITANGGTLNYSFAWNNTLVTEDNTGITAGTYTVTVTDAHACTATVAQVITQPAAIAIAGVVTNEKCFGDANGAVDITVSGGTAGYTFNWSNGATTEDITAVAAGNYIVTVTDAHSCTATASFTVNQPDSISSVSSTSLVTCPGGSNGAAGVLASGGNSPYSYLWSNGSHLSSISGLTDGTYTVTITDSKGCAAVRTLVVGTIPPMQVSAVVNNMPCDQVLGSIDLSVAAGTPGYQFHWSNNYVAEDPTKLPEGTYSVTITDANGCVKDSTFTIVNTHSFTVKASEAVTIQLGDGTTISATATGSSEVQYNWTPINGLTSPDLPSTEASPVKTVTYTVHAVDTNGCLANDTVTVFVIPNHDLYVPNAFSPNADGNNDYFEFYGNKKAIRYVVIKIFNRWGEKVFESNDINFMWDGYYRQVIQEPGVFVYTMDIAFMDGYQVRDQKGSITLIR
ncbi:MAG: gliding motility-associated C-terminal domain-containing protein, partial [Chitinophagales bacterium]